MSFSYIETNQKTKFILVFEILIDIVNLFNN